MRERRRAGARDEHGTATAPDARCARPGAPAIACVSALSSRASLGPHPRGAHRAEATCVSTRQLLQYLLQRRPEKKRNPEVCARWSCKITALLKNESGATGDPEERRARTMVLEGWVSRLGVPIFEHHGRAGQGPAADAGCHAWPAKEASPKAEAATRVVLVDFDDVLFRTPRRPRWWPFHGYEDMVQSLLPPCVPARLSEEWFNPAVVDEVLRLQADTDGPPTWTVAHTFRPTAFRGCVGRVLEQAPSGLQFDSARFRPVCACCSPLGFTHTGEAGYGRLSALLTEEPQRADDKHLLVILGDVLEDCPHTCQVVLFLSTTPTRPPAVPSAKSQRAVGERSSQYHRMCRLLGLDTPAALSRALKIEIRAVDPSPCSAGIPTADQLSLMTYWDDKKRHAARSRTRTDVAQRARCRAEFLEHRRRQLGGHPRAPSPLEPLFAGAPSSRTTGRWRRWWYVCDDEGRRDAVKLGKRLLRRLAGASASALAFDDASLEDDAPLDYDDYAPTCIHFEGDAPLHSTFSLLDGDAPLDRDDDAPTCIHLAYNDGSSDVRSACDELEDAWLVEGTARPRSGWQVAALCVYVCVCLCLCVCVSVCVCVIHLI